jgi:DNA repair protein RecO (recombination protein O)
VVANRHQPKWKAGFSIVGGGVINLEITDLANDGNPNGDRPELSISDAMYNRISHYLNASELLAMQELAQTDLADNILETHTTDWLAVERLLRAYAQYHFDRPIQSSALIDNCFFNI